MSDVELIPVGRLTHFGRNTILKQRGFVQLLPCTEILSFEVKGETPPRGRGGCSWRSASKLVEMLK